MSLSNTRTRAPSYKGFKPASENASKSKRSNRNVQTENERVLCKELRRLGLYFRMNMPGLPGKPDIVFRSARLVVFCDGDFWHGRNWRSLRQDLDKGTNSVYWLAKIRSNRLRDLKQTKLLKEQGWAVMRFWETDVKYDPSSIAKRIERAVTRRRLDIQKLKHRTCNT
jgi:DNA mismatch endonuclease (patch repair protein)